MKYFCSAIWNPNSTPVLFGIFSKFIALFSRAIWDEELYKTLTQTKFFKEFLMIVTYKPLLARTVIFFAVTTPPHHLSLRQK